MSGDGSPDRPAVAGLELELGMVLVLLVVAAVVIVRAEAAVKRTKAQLRTERNRRLDAEDLAETRERSIDGVLETLKEANDRNETLSHQLAARGDRIPDAPPAATGGGSAGTGAAGAGSVD